VDERSYVQHSAMPLIYDLEWRFYKSLLQSAAEMAGFALSALFCTLFMGFKVRSFRNYLATTCCGFYGNVLIVISIIWGLNGRVLHWLAVQLFLLISHFQIQRVLCPENASISAVVIVLAGLLGKRVSGHFANELLNLWTFD